MILRLLKRLFSAEVLGVILVLLALRTLTFGISASLRGTDTRYLFWVCLLAAGIGWLLDKREWSGLQASIGIATLGVVGVWILGARLTLPLIGLAESVLALLPQVLPAIRDRILLDTSAMRESWTVIVQASSALTARWQTWLIGMNKNVTVNDALVRNMIWTLLFWLLAAWTGWFTARRNAILALLPNVLLLAMVLAYSALRIETLWLMVFLLLLLMGVWNYRNNTIQWQRRRVDYSDSILYDNTQAVLFLALAIGGIAFITPSISWRDLRDFIRERNTNEAAEMLGIREQVVPGQNTFLQTPSLPRQHLLTEGFAQSQKLVMTVRTGELPPVSNPALPTEAPRYYWRSTVYDEYMGAGWITSTAFPQNVQANTPLIPGLLDGYRLLRLDVQLHQPEGKLFWSGVLYSTDVPFQAEWRVRPGSSLFADQTALLQADLFAAASSASSYSMDVYIPALSMEDLRAAPPEYPREIQERYLRLPRGLPGRVHRLAEEITSGLEDPYEKARAIETYLRENYPYDLEVPAPPRDQDVADYFLFDLRRGYCDYYATAMVVLARASGLPARFVSGYASGSYDAPNAQYIVRESNAHSWAEVYFPEIGWIEFEPTSSQPLIERAETPSELPAGSPSSTSTEKFLFQLRSTGTLYWILPFVILMLLVLLYFTFFERLWILRLAPDRAVENLYRRYYRMGRPLAGERTGAETALDFSEKLSRKMEQIHRGSQNLKSAQRVQDDIRRLTDIYLLSLFSNHSIGEIDARNAFDLWVRLRKQLWIARIRELIARTAASGREATA